MSRAKPVVLLNLVTLKKNQGQVEEALALLQQSLEIKERIGNVQGQANSLLGIGRIKQDQGQVEEALALFQQSLEIFEHIGHVQGQAIAF